MFTLSRREIFALILLLGGIFFRVIRVDFAPEVLPNFSPLMAAALCGAVFLPRLIGLILPVVALLISDTLLNLHDGSPVISSQFLWTLPCYLLAVGIGWSLRERQCRSLLPVLAGTFAASVIFYLVTNTECWFASAAYPQSFSGWVQALTTGLPGFPPTWTFFRNSLASDLIFAALFVAVERSLAEKQQVVSVVA